uniref:Uncharacterized protein n=1 Tax=Candidatus Kentrum sp. DK TaxID=2126562 RepID=A0A450SUQ3_9GAMM|nr:MAG: hypothetical protein BECKDK2373B_GA0170837_106812 [Candidatus Kentron sp. DK]VFJ59442.1 MAG: hypothetical protein BECKDK2373C_GA0170839_107131 [Candidatus Kentron sp. DK]
MGATATQPLHPIGKEKTDRIYLPDEKNAPELTPRMEADIDRRLAIAQEEIKNGQYVRLDDEFMERFLEEAHRRNAGIIEASQSDQSAK